MNTPALPNMSLGTARQVLKQPDGYKPHIVAAARLTVAKWEKRARAKTVTRF